MANTRTPTPEDFCVRGRFRMYSGQMQATVLGFDQVYNVEPCWPMPVKITHPETDDIVAILKMGGNGQFVPAGKE